MQSYFAYGVPLFPDAACARDYLQADDLDGLARRKMMHELQQYGCFVHLEAIYHVSLKESITLEGPSETRVRAQHCLLIYDAELNEMIGHELSSSSEITLEGVLLEKDLMPITSDELRARLLKARTTGAASV